VNQADLRFVLATSSLASAAFNLLQHVALRSRLGVDQPVASRWRLGPAIRRQVLDQLFLGGDLLVDAMRVEITSAMALRSVSSAFSLPMRCSSTRARARWPRGSCPSDALGLDADHALAVLLRDLDLPVLVSAR